jgi:hypothetical protein
MGQKQGGFEVGSGLSENKIESTQCGLRSVGEQTKESGQEHTNVDM